MTSSARCAGRRRRPCRCAQHARPAEDRVERRAQLVRDRREELVLGAVGRPRASSRARSSAESRCWICASISLNVPTEQPELVVARGLSRAPLVRSSVDATARSTRCMIGSAIVRWSRAEKPRAAPMAASANSADDAEVARQALASLAQVRHDGDGADEVAFDHDVRSDELPVPNRRQDGPGGARAASGAVARSRGPLVRREALAVLL